MKVTASTKPCSRQCARPCSTAENESLAPCRKNSSAMAALVRPPAQRAASPLTGTTLASAMSATSVRTNASGSQLGRRIAGTAQGASGRLRLWPLAS